MHEQRTQVASLLCYVKPLAVRVSEQPFDGSQDPVYHMYASSCLQSVAEHVHTPAVLEQRGKHEQQLA